MIGEKIFNYEINAHLGQGGMGTVYRATDSMLGREVALKMLHPQLTSQPQFLERFKKEARVLAQLLHPNIAVIYNFIEQAGNHFMVMEYVEGTNLDDLLKRYGALPAKFLVPIFIQALEGLQHAHKKNVFHRDIKPANLMLTPDGTLKLMDFGIAKVAGEQKMTQVNKIVGTVEFMAPELIEGKQASVASDIYAMGATFYELVSGQLPFKSDTDFNLMQAILKQKARSPEKLNASVPKALGDIIMKALEKNPDNRYPDARSFQQALISAFPNYRDIDMGILKAPQQTVLSYTADAGQTRVEQGMGTVLSESMETKLDNPAKLFSIKQFFEEQVLTMKRLPFILAGIGLFFFLMILGSMIFGKKDSGANSVDSVSSKIDTVKKVDQNNLVTDNRGGTLVTPSENVAPPLHADQPTEKKEAVVKTKKKKQETQTVIDKPVEKTTENSNEEKRPEPKEVYIDSRVEVALGLRENLSNADRGDRPISFTVTHSVSYGGVTIIRQGAIAKGSISIGRILTSIEIYSVMGANGQELSFQSARFHRKKSELDTDRNYEATLQQGIRMRF